MSRLVEFEKKNRDLLENLKKRMMDSIVGVTAISTGLSITDAIDPSILTNYGVTALVGYIGLNILWGFEQRHDLTPTGDTTESSNRQTEEDKQPSTSREPEKEKA